ncbi:MAG: tetratricopeptide repeat protein [Elusimicrobia bacterium]|nr:tetratricopeptide repeat protein [Elusimicrobiota bacterium]
MKLSWIALAIAFGLAPGTALADTLGIPVKLPVRSVWALAFSPDGSRLITANYEAVKIWKTADGTLEKTLKVKEVCGIAAAPEGDVFALRVGFRTGEVQLWRLSETRPYKKFKVGRINDGASRSLAFSPDGKLLATLSMGEGGGSFAALWNVDNGKQEKTRGTKAPPRSLAFSGDGRNVILGGNDGSVRAWNLKSGEVHSFRGNPQPVTDIASSRSGRWFATVSGDALLKVYRMSDGTVFRTQELAYGGSVFSTPDERYVGALTGAGLLQLWKVYGDRTPVETELVAKPSIGRFSPDGSRFAAAGEDEVVLIPWKPASPLAGRPAPVGTLDQLLEKADEAPDNLKSLQYSDDAVRAWKPADGPLKKGLAYKYRGVFWELLGELERGIADYSEAVAVSPRDPGPFSSRGDAYRKLGEADLALADYTKAIALKADWGEPYLGRAKTLFLLKDEPKAALADLDQALELDPKNGAALLLRAEALRDTGDCAAAVKSYTAAADADKDVAAKAYIGMAECAVAGRLPDVAIALFGEAIALDAENPVPYRKRGMLLHAAGQPDKAVADLDKAVTLDKRDAASYFIRGLISYNAGKYDDSAGDFSEAIRMGPVPDALNFMGLLSFDKAVRTTDSGLQSSYYNSAESYFEQYLELVPGDAMARRLFAEAKSRSQALTDAKLRSWHASRQSVSLSSISRSIIGSIGASGSSGGSGSSGYSNVTAPGKTVTLQDYGKAIQDRVSRQEDQALRKRINDTLWK